MFEWRVTKFDPALRDGAGRFLRDDWTAISDVGSVHNGEVVTREAYLAVESAYVGAALGFVEAAGQPPLFANGVECQDHALGPASEGVADRAPLEGELVTSVHMPGVIRASLRELMWCRLESGDAQTFVHFGYDFYMYVKTPRDAAVAIRRAQQLGLFVEECASPYARGDVE